MVVLYMSKVIKIKEVGTLLTNEQRESLMCSAVEGGSSYWCSLGDDLDLKKYKVAGQDNYLHNLMLRAVYAGENINIYDVDDDVTLLGVFNKKNMLKGEKIMLKEYPYFFGQAINEGSGDATTGDIWFQLSIFNTDIYG